MLERKVVAVTGAGSGIGRAVALLAAQYGVGGVVLADLNSHTLAETTSRLSGLGVKVETIVANVAESRTGDLIVERAVERFGRLDAAVNAAGITGVQKEFVDISDEEFDDVFAVNLRGVFRCMRAQLRHMYTQEAGSIVNVSSASLYGMHAEVGPYITSKSGVLAMSRVAAKEAGRHGVRVNTVCPGITDTSMSRQSAADNPAVSAIAARIPLGRTGDPAEIAEGILWLCSDRSSFTNGASLVIDGGRSG